MATLSACCRGGRRYAGASLFGFCCSWFVGPPDLTRLVAGVGCSGGLTGLSATKGVWKAHSTLPGGALRQSCFRSLRKRLSGRREPNAGGFMHDQARPNVVMIVADTFRTHHLDEFARSSVVFDQHVVSSFPTMPARADMLTGTFSYTHMGWEPLPRHLTTLPDALSQAGYHTMGVVDTPFFIRNGFGYDRGFDDFIWVRGQGDDTRPHERADARSTWRSEEDRMVARTVTQAERWLERHHEEQFFLYVDTWDPHEPWDAPEYYTKKYREGYDGEQIYPAYGNWKKAGLQKDDVDLGHATYCGEVTMVDFWIGRLLHKLDAL